MRTLLVVAGAPGPGKSSAVRAATAAYDRLPMNRDDYPARDALFRGGRLVAVELGRTRPDFPGTDTLPMNVNPTACRYLADAPEAPPLVVAEGARLSNRRFLAAGVAAGWRVILMHLDNPNAPQWRAGRAGRLGARQNEAWAKGRATAARNLADDPPAGVTVITVAAPTAVTVALTDLLQEAGHTNG